MIVYYVVFIATLLTSKQDQLTITDKGKLYTLLYTLLPCYCRSSGSHHIIQEGKQGYHTNTVKS